MKIWSQDGSVAYLQQLVSGTTTGYTLPVLPPGTYDGILDYVAVSGSNAFGIPGATGYSGYGKENDFTIVSVAGTPAQVLTPPNGSTFTSTSGIFTWTTGTGASAYALWVGSTPGTYDLYGQFVSGTSEVVPLPVDGRPLYVNLLSSINNQWLDNSYTYTACNAAPLRF